MPAFFIIFIILICAVLWGMHVAVYRGLLAIFSISHPVGVLALKTAFISLPIIFVINFFLSSRYNTGFTKLLYKLSASWIGMIFYFLLAVSLFFLLRAITGGTGAFITLAGKLFIVSALIASAYGIYNASNIQVTEARIEIPNLPESWKGKRAVFYSDVHLGQVRGKEYAERLAKKIDSLKPDIIFNGGDLFDGTAVDTDVVLQPLKGLGAPLGHFLVMGNHEEFGNNEAFARAITDAGIRILDNEKIIIEGVQLVGVDYRDATGKARFAGLLQNIEIDPGQPSILLKHTPFDLDVAEEKGISLQLSGHTHRAQMFPLSFITKLVYKGYDYGLKKFGDMTVLVSNGVGTWGPPLRVGTKSEIVLIIFQ